jgi:hypothetical protein
MTKVLTLHQPWATLVALGVKTIETRSWSTNYRGPLLIHAGVRGPGYGNVGDWWHGRCHHDRARWVTCDDTGDNPDAVDVPLPLGAIVASCTLADVVPMVEWGADPPHDHLCIGQDGRLRLWAFTRETPRGWAAYDPTKRPSGGGDNVDDRTDQARYGDFRPGRYAWLLEDVKSTTERCPACWGQRTRGPAGDCQVCDQVGTCDPIPARGAQRLWTWRPE